MSIQLKSMPAKGFPRRPADDYDAIRPHLRTGDLLFCSGSVWMSEMIQTATGSAWSHVGFVWHLKPIDRVMVLESVESQGVRTVPLSKYLRDYDNRGHPYPGGVVVARHTKFPGEQAETVLRKFGQHSVDRFGYPYDRDEIAKITARIAGSFLPFTKTKKRELKRDKEFICSEYVWECYRAIGIEIAHDDLGFIAPVHFARDPNVKLIAVLRKK